MNKRYLAVFFILICLGLSFSFYLKKTGVQVKKPVNVKVIQEKYSLLYLPQYIALWQGYFKEEKLQLDISTVASKYLLWQALKSGKGDMVLTGLENGIFARTDDGEKLVAFSELTKIENVFLVARKESADFQWDSLKDKTVITGPPGSRETVVFKGILSRYGLAPNRQVTLYTNIPASLQIGAFKSGTGDYILLSGPDAFYTENTGLGKIIAPLAQGIGELPGLVYLAREDYVKTHPEALQRFVNAIYKAQLWLQQHNATETLQLIEQHSDLNEKELKEKESIRLQLERYKTLNIWSEGPEISEEKYGQLLDLFLKAKEIPEPVPYTQLIENNFAQNARQKVSSNPNPSFPR